MDDTVRLMDDPVALMGSQVDQIADLHGQVKSDTPKGKTVQPR